MALNSGEPCVWERTETDVMVSQEDTHSLRRSTPQCLAHRVMVAAYRRWSASAGGVCGWRVG